MAAMQQMLIGVGGFTTPYWNASDKDTLIVLSNGNRDATNSNGTVDWSAVRSTTSHASGKWYAEVLLNAISTNSNVMFGVANGSTALTNFVGAAAGGWSIQNDGGGPSTLRLAGSSSASGLAQANAGDRMMVAYDAGSGKIWLGAKGVWYNSGDPGAGTNATTTIAAGTTLYLALSIAVQSNTTTLCSQSGENGHAIPSGFSMWG